MASRDAAGRKGPVMLAKTHITVGMAAALAVTQPTTVPALICAVAGGGLGGWISDIDVRGNPDAREVLKSVPSITAVLALSLVLDKLFDLGIVSSVLSGAGPGALFGAVLFCALAAVGMGTPHRTFTHSLLCCSLWGLSACLVHPRVGAAMSVGLASHLVLDLFNMRGERLLFPLKKTFCLGRCPSNGRANTALGTIGLVTAIALVGWFGIGAVAGSTGVPAMLADAASSTGFGGLPLLAVYLIAVNVLNVAAFVLLCVVCGFLPEAEAFFTYSMLVLSALGGAFGMLAVLLFTSVLLGAAGEKAQNRGDDGDSLLYIVAVALSLLWVVAIYLAWSGDIASGQVVLSPMSHVPLIAYLVAINVATIVVLLRDDEQRRKSTLHPREIGVLALAVAGGSAGALLALGLKRSGTNTSQVHYKYGLPIILGANAVIVALLVVAGVA